MAIVQVGFTTPLYDSIVCLKVCIYDTMAYCTGCIFILFLVFQISGTFSIL